MFENKKKLIAIAIAGAFALPLAAQAQSNVTIYGNLYPEITSVRTSGATAKGAAVSTLTAAAAGTPDSTTVSMVSSNSRLGFRGTEDLGNGMKAIFQLEMGLHLDDGMNASSTAGALFSRDTFVGIAGGFGSVKLGSMDTVYKTIGDTLTFKGVSSGNIVSNSNILGRPGFGTSSAATFHIRSPNSIMYQSPNFAGFTGLFDYSLGEVPGNNSKGSVISTGMTYGAGPVYLAVAYEMHNDFFGGSKNIPTALSNASNAAANSTDSATRLTARYDFTSNTRAEANFSHIKLDETGGTIGKFANYKHDTWSIGVEQKINAVTLAAAYGQASAGTCSLVGGVACSTAGLDGKLLSLGAFYSFSKRTSLFALYSLMSNGDSAVYNDLSVGAPTPGQNISSFAVGIQHYF